MTDRLATLMRTEADTLDVPSAPAPEILAAGRRLRRRSTTRRGGAAALVVLAVAVTALVARGGGQDTPTPPVTRPSSSPVAVPSLPKAYAVGDTVYLGDGRVTATMPEVAQTLYYTSAGILVRTNKNGFSDGGAPFHFQLVGPHAKTTELGVTLGDVAPSADPTEPYLAWATMTGDRIQVVIHDVTTDKDVATVDVPGKFTWGGWEAPPVALSGDLVYVGTDSETAVVNWRTGEATTSDAVPGSRFPEVHGRYALTEDSGSAPVVDVDTGRTALDVPLSHTDPPVSLSPDGSHVMVGAEGHTEVYDVSSGNSVQVPSGDWGWSANGESVFRVDGSTMTTCSTSSGRCHDTPTSPVEAHAFVRYAGIAFES